MIEAEMASSPHIDLDNIPIGALSLRGGSHAKSHRASDPPHHELSRSSYRSVSALLVSWEADDLNVLKEVTKFETVLKAEYNFATNHCILPAKDPETYFIKRLITFRSGRGEDDLLIMYYAGHADGDNINYVWAANQSENSPTLNFTCVQNLLLFHSGPVLLILDCDYSSLAARGGGLYDKWFFGASSKESPAVGVSFGSFTSALTRALEHYAYLYWARNADISVQSIHHHLSVKEQTLKFSPHLIRLAEEDSPPTDLKPILFDIAGPSKVMTALASTLSNNTNYFAPRPPNKTVQTQPAQETAPHRPDKIPLAQDKESVYERMSCYDTVFLIDDSTSMKGSKWKTVSLVLARIVAIAVKYDEDGVDIRFFNKRLPDADRKHLNTTEKVMKLFGRVEPRGPTLTADLLEEELSSYMRKLIKDPDGKGLNLIVLTDGEPKTGQNVKKVIVEYARKLENCGASKLKVGIQFVQIGSSDDVKAFLQTLDDDIQKEYNLDRDVSVFCPACQDPLLTAYI